MTNNEIAIKTIKALKENNRMELEKLAIENFELVTFIIDNEQYLTLDSFRCGTLLNLRYITVIRITINNKIKDLRNNITKELNKYLSGCWNSHCKHFLLNDTKYKYN